ncbi:MAG: ABC transporter permease [Candidatus Acidiferrales bacterium]
MHPQARGVDAQPGKSEHATRVYVPLRRQASGLEPPGANTAIFSLVNSILLRPLPVKDPKQLTVLTLQQKQGPLQLQFSIADYRDIRSQTTGVYSDLIAHTIGLDGLNINGKADRILTDYVSANYFSGLGLQPALGRLLLPSEGETPSADPVMVLAYSYWKTRFGGDPGIVGRKVSVDGHPLTIVGVAPEGFHWLNQFISIQGYLPLGMAFIEGYPSDLMTNRQNRTVFLLGRLQPGASLQ